DDPILSGRTTSSYGHWVSGFLDKFIGHRTTDIRHLTSCGFRSFVSQLHRPPLQVNHAHNCQIDPQLSKAAPASRKITDEVSGRVMMTARTERAGIGAYYVAHASFAETQANNIGDDRASLCGGDMVFLARISRHCVWSHLRSGRKAHSERHVHRPKFKR